MRTCLDGVKMRTLNANVILALFLIFIGAVGRIALSSYPNIETIMVVTFIAAVYIRKWYALLVPLSAIAISDLVLGNLAMTSSFSQILIFTYTGTMEAVSRGAAEAGGHVVGITTEEIESWRPGAANSFVLEERSYKTLKARLYALIDACDAAMALPGGIGTLTEISAMWSQMQVSALPARPLILIGPGWKTVMDSFFEQFPSYVPEEHRPLLSYAKTVEAAAEMLTQE